jgi:uncharacterized protein
LRKILRRRFRASQDDRSFMDITPLIPKGQQLINSYGAGGFTIGGERVEGSQLVLPGQRFALEAKALAEFTPAMLSPLEGSGTELLLIGGGAHMSQPDSAIRMALRGWGIAAEPMDTGAACRTFNVLLAEGRQVAALLVAV